MAPVLSDRYGGLGGFVMALDPFFDALGVTDEEAQSQRDFMRMSGRPSDDSFELQRVFLNRADFRQLCFNDR